MNLYFIKAIWKDGISGKDRVEEIYVTAPSSQKAVAAAERHVPHYKTQVVFGEPILLASTFFKRRHQGMPQFITRY